MPEQFFQFSRILATEARQIWHAWAYCATVTVNTKGPVLLTLAMLSFAAMGALAKLSGETIPFTEIVFFRSSIGAVVVLLWVWQRGISVRGRRPLLLLARAIAGTTALFMFFYAITHISVANAMLLNQTAPVFVLPLAAIFLKERITPAHLLLVTTALLGVGLVVKPTLEVHSAPSLLALASAVFAAVAYILVRRLSETEHPLVIVLWFNVVSAVVALPAALPGFVIPAPEKTGELLGMALMATAGQVLMTVAYRHGEAGRLAILGSLGAVFGAGFDLLIWRHLPDGATAIGGVIIIASCSLLQVRKRG